MNRLKIVNSSVAVLLIVAVVAVIATLRNSPQPVPPPDLPVAVPVAEVRVKAVERKTEATGHEAIEASAAVAVVCGADSTTADRYEARNDALQSIARRRDLPENDVAALVKFLASAKDPLPVERMAALKNDVMNLLRSQEPPPKGLAETLIGAAEFARCKQWKLGMTCFPL